MSGSTGLCDPNTGEIAKTRVPIGANTAQCRATRGTDPCDVDCVMEFSDWTTVPCTNGVQTRTESVKAKPKNNGLPCPTTARTETQKCKVDCVMEYPNERTVDCDPKASLKTLVERMTTPPQVGGEACRAAQIKTVACPVKCVKAYPPWDPAVHPCDPKTGFRTREEIVITEMKNGEAECDTLQTEITPCAVDCEIEYPDWPTTTDGEKELCDPQTGLMERKPRIKYPALNKGRADEECLDEAESEFKKCDVDCKKEWGPPSTCDKVTGEIKTTEVITVVTRKNKCKECEPLTFKLTDCPVDCEKKFPSWNPLLH